MRSLAVAEGMDASPPYAKGALARELRGILGDLAAAEVNDANLSLLEGLKLCFDRHGGKALAALDDVSLRELEAVAEKLTRRRDGLREFGIVFSDAARARRGGAGPSTKPSQRRLRKPRHPSGSTCARL